MVFDFLFVISAHINESNPSKIQPLFTNKTQDRPGDKENMI